MVVNVWQNNSYFVYIEHEILVKKCHVNAGIPKDPNKCAVALALQEYTGIVWNVDEERYQPDYNINPLSRKVIGDVFPQTPYNFLCPQGQYANWNGCGLMARSSLVSQKIKHFDKGIKVRPFPIRLIQEIYLRYSISKPHMPNFQIL